MARRRRQGATLSALEARIQNLAGQFAREIIAALRRASLEDIAELSGGSAPPQATGARAATGGSPKKRRNYPKCQWPGCGNNLSPRTRPWCGAHYRRVKAGEKPPVVAKAAAAGAPAKGAPRAKRPKS